MDRNTLRNSFTRLQAGGHKLTRPRRRIIEELHNQSRSFTALDLHRQVADGGVSLASVYRTVQLLADLGLIEVSRQTGDEKRYVACSPERHHHHVICSRCGRAADVTECTLHEFEARVRELTGFVIESHSLEFHGYCAACRS